MDPNVAILLIIPVVTKDLPVSPPEKKSYFDKNRTHDFRTTSRCADYLLDHSDDDIKHKIQYEVFCIIRRFFVAVCSASGEIERGHPQSIPGI